MKAYLVSGSVEKITDITTDEVIKDLIFYHTLVHSKEEIPKARAKLNLLYNIPKKKTSWKAVELPEHKRDLIEYINDLLYDAQKKQKS